jgi:thiamine-monophosphate kinase
VALGSGDDAAITVPAGATATSVDLAIEDVHFRRSTASLPDIGHKALAAAMSDLAAMGARPGEAYVQLGLPDAMSDEDCLELADGMAGVAREHGVVVLGGDISRSGPLVVAVTVVGHADSPAALVSRAGAPAGAEVHVTGELGGAAAGLLLLERPELRDAVDDDVAQALIARQLRPEPRIAAGIALAAAGAGAMIDLSDGLVADAGHVAAASGVGIELEADRLPAAPGVAEVAAAAGIDPLELVAGGGEDYELLAVLPEGSAHRAEEALTADGVALSRAGRTGPGAKVLLRERSGAQVVIHGYDHLRSRSSDRGEHA